MFFLKAHRGRNAWWRWLATIVGTLTLWLAGHIPLIAFVAMETERLGLGDQAFITAGLPAGVDRNLFLFFSLVPFAVALFSLRVFLRRLHHKPMLWVMTGRTAFDWRRVFLGFGVWLAIVGIGSFAVLPAGSYTYQFDIATFWTLAIIALILIPIQTTFEEVFFRGYLMQGISLLAGNKIVPLIAVTLLFTLVHFGNPEFSADYTKGALTYLTISATFALTAVLDDGLEVPCGIHAANNLFLVLALSPADGSFVTNAIFSVPVAELMRTSPHLDAIMCLLAFGIFFVVLNWRFATLVEPTTPNAAPSP